MTPSPRQRIVIILLWGLLLAACAYLWWRTRVPIKEMPDLLRAWFHSQGPWGPLLYIAAYTIRPLFLFPASLLTAASGLLWGPMLGIAYTIVGENFSAALAFGMARFLGKGALESSEYRWIRSIDSHLRENGIISVAIMRLAYIPFDIVNFGCGLTSMRFKDYIIGTFFGILPGVVTFVYFGSGWLNPRYLLIGGILFLLSLGLAKWIKTSRAAQKIGL